MHKAHLLSALTVMSKDVRYQKTDTSLQHSPALLEVEDLEVSRANIVHKQSSTLGDLKNFT